MPEYFRVGNIMLYVEDATYLSLKRGVPTFKTKTNIYETDSKTVSEMYLGNVNKYYLVDYRNEVITYAMRVVHYAEQMK